MVESAERAGMTAWRHMRRSKAAGRPDGQTPALHHENREKA